MMRAVALLTLQTMLQVAQAQSLYGPSSCTTPDDFERLVEQVETNCCDQFDQQNNCDGSGIPAVCDTRCAPVFVEFWAACSAYITTSLPSPALRQQFVAMQGRCHATLQANTIHDTDLVKPGDQVDLSTPLLIPVNCHGMQMKTAKDLDENTGPMDSLWSVMVDGESRCLSEWRIINPACTCAACPLTYADPSQRVDTCHCADYNQASAHPGCDQESNHGWKTTAHRDSCEAHINRQAVQAALLGRYGECVEHRPPPPPPEGEHGHEYIDAVVHTVSTGGIPGKSTYQLLLQLPQIDYELPADQRPTPVDNVYTIYGSPAETAGADAGEPAHVMDFPPAYQEATPFGVNIGGTNPAFWTYSPSAQWDSWLAVGSTDASAKDAVSSIGIDFDSWTDTQGVSVDNGAVFWMDPTKAPSDWPCVIAQITVGTDTKWSATVNARGKMGGYTSGSGDDWEATRLIFSDATVPAWEGGGEGTDEGGGHRRRSMQEKGYPDGPPSTVVPGSGGMADMICDYSLDTNEDGAIDDGDMPFSDLTFFEAILSKDAVFYLASDPITSAILSDLECDEVVGGRR